MGNGVCQVEGCASPVSQAGHELCLAHWRVRSTLQHCDVCQRWTTATRCKRCSVAVSSPKPSPAAVVPEDDDSPGYLSSTKLGKHFGLSNVKINLILAELGWIEKYVKGWVPTDRGNALGANIKEMRNGTPFVVWPASILNNRALLESLSDQTGYPAHSLVTAATNLIKRLVTGDRPPTAPSAQTPSDRTTTATTTPKADDFRQKFPATHRTQDGHLVRSRAEMLIDNWLYMQGIVHAYERRLPIEEDCYCDFYVPKGKGVYIEYWGLENDRRFGPTYRARKAEKQALYAKYELRLIELTDAEIEKLDDVLPRMLLRFGIESV